MNSYPFIRDRPNDPSYSSRPPTRCSSEADLEKLGRWLASIHRRDRYRAAGRTAAEQAVQEAYRASRTFTERSAHADDVAAGNLIGTLLYFVLFNLGLIAVAVPVTVPARVVALDWPFLAREPGRVRSR